VQICFQYFKGLGLPHTLPREEMAALIRLKPFKPSEKAKALIDPKAFNLVIHPGISGRNTLPWPAARFAELMKLLPVSVKVFVTGSEKEGETFGDLVKHHPNAVGVFGTLTLSELTDFLSLVDGVVVNSTGPLHISAALGTKVIGLFPPQKDLNVERWGAVGKHVINIEAPHCEQSRKGERCDCMTKITPEQVFAVMQKEWGM
jgi:ADP-heptose:LPS heptosyltransferase